MQKRGISESNISRQLQNEGISPREINDALNQIKVKDAVSSQDIPNQEMEMQTQEMSEQGQGAQDMQQSIMQSYPAQQENQQYAYPEQASQESQGYYPEQPQVYQQESYYPQQANLDTDTISEIAEQVVQEKFAAFEKKTGDIAAFKNDIKEKVSDLNERLKRIENSIDKLQQAVISKIGEFGETTETIQKDLEALHNTTSKLMNPLIDNYKELRKLAGNR